MSFVKKSFCSLLSFSLLTTYSVPAHPTPDNYESSPYSTQIALGCTGAFIALAYGVHWYNNYYKVDHLSSKYLAEKLNHEIIKAHNLLTTLSSDSIDTIINRAYPHFDHKYLTCHHDIEESISQLTYYVNALKRKSSQKVFFNDTLINKAVQLIDDLKHVREQVEETLSYTQEKAEKDNTSQFSL